MSSADLLLLNKLDLVDADDVPKLEARLRELEPEAPILHATHADIDPALLFPPDPDGLRATRRAEAPEAPPHAHEDFESFELRVEAGADPDALAERIRGLGALRAKGFVETGEGVRLLQAVGDRVELTEVESAPDAAFLGRVVVIRRVTAER